MSNVIRLKSAKSLECDMPAAVSAFLTACKAKNLSQETLTFYKYRLQSFTRFTDRAPVEVDASTIRDFALHIRESHSAQTVNHCLTVLKSFFGFLCDEGFIPSNPALPVKKQKVRKPVIETFSPEQVKSLLATCDKSFIGVRDRAILLTLLDTGLRASELCGIRLEDVSWNQQTFQVIGKGDKERIVPYGQGVRQALNSYMTKRAGVECGTLFVGCYGEPLTRSGLLILVRKRCRKAGIQGIRPSPHTLRHTMAVSYLRSGGDTFTLQKLLGHTSQEMTRRYCESMSAEDVQAKHRQFSPVDNMRLNEQKSGRKRLR